MDALSPATDPPDLLGYVELALRGGFPEAALQLAGANRRAWLEGYVDQLLTRDVETLYGHRDPRLLRRYFEALALNSAGLAENKTLYEAAGIDRKTAIAYERLLTNLLVLDTMPAWMSNRLSRLVKSGKRYLVDPSLIAAALRLDQAAVLRDGDLLGRVLETFVVAQIRPEAELSPSRPSSTRVDCRELPKSVASTTQVSGLRRDRRRAPSTGLELGPAQVVIIPLFCKFPANYPASVQLFFLQYSSWYDR